MSYYPDDDMLKTVNYDNVYLTEICDIESVHNDQPQPQVQHFAQPQAQHQVQHQAQHRVQHFAQPQAQHQAQHQVQHFAQPQAQHQDKHFAQSQAKHFAQSQNNIIMFLLVIMFVLFSVMLIRLNEIKISMNKSLKMSVKALSTLTSQKLY